MIRDFVTLEPDIATTAFGVVAPNSPGCFAAGDTLDEATTHAEQVAALWIDAALDTSKSRSAWIARMAIG